jgi:hypothetical protein
MAFQSSADLANADHVLILARTAAIGEGLTPEVAYLEPMLFAIYAEAGISVRYGMSLQLDPRLGAGKVRLELTREVISASERLDLASQLSNLSEAQFRLAVGMLVGQALAFPKLNFWEVVERILRRFAERKSV